ncbi:hypothetical protein Tco_1232767 [Tanacetum coccineum]
MKSSYVARVVDVESVENSDEERVMFYLRHLDRSLQEEMENVPTSTLLIQESRLLLYVETKNSKDEKWIMLKNVDIHVLCNKAGKPRRTIETNTLKEDGGEDGKEDETKMAKKENKGGADLQSHLPIAKLRFV